MKHWASEPIDDLQIKVMICILLIYKWTNALFHIFLLNGCVKSMIELYLVWPLP